MGKAERATALTQRRRAVKVISDIRRTRRMLAKHPFDANTLNAINGSNGAIEGLVGRSIVFGALTEDERVALKHDINAALDDNENRAFDLLRSATIAYFEDIQKIVDSKMVSCSEEQLKYLSFKKEAALEAFNTAQMPKGSLDIERTISSLEHIEVMAEELEETVPDVDHDLEVTDPEYEEEKHDVPDELPTEDDDDDDDDDYIEEVELPDDDEDDDEDDDDDNDEDDDDDDDCGCKCSADVSWVKRHNRYVKAMASFMNNEEASLEALGFTAEKSTSVVEKYMQVMPKYISAIAKLVDTVNPTTCTNDDLLKGSTKCYKRIDRIVSLIEKFEPVRAALNETCEHVIGTASSMLVAQTTK